MNQKITLTLKTLITPQFQEAFKALGADSIPVTSRFRIAQTIQKLPALFTAYDEARNALIKELGQPESVILKRKQEARAGKSPSPEDAFIARRLQAITDGDEDKMAIDNDDKETLAKFHAENERLLSETFSTELTAKVPLSPQSKLTADQMLVLMDLIEVPDADRPPGN